MSEQPALALSYRDAVILFHNLFFIRGFQVLLGGLGRERGSQVSQDGFGMMLLAS